MTALTRRRDPDARQEAWLIHYGDVRVGSISLRTGAGGNDHWAWACGFYPASQRMVLSDGTAKSFDDARAAFEAAWHDLLSKLTEDDFSRYRHHEAFDRWKHAMWDAGCTLPTQVAEGRSRCFCGADITIADSAQHVYSAHMECRETA